MGTNQVTATVRATLSNHNSLQDELDLVRWRHFLRRLEELSRYEEYKQIHLNVDCDDVVDAEVYCGPLEGEICICTEATPGPVCERLRQAGL